MKTRCIPIRIKSPVKKRSKRSPALKQAKKLFKEKKITARELRALTVCDRAFQQVQRDAHGGEPPHTSLQECVPRSVSPISPVASKRAGSPKPSKQVDMDPIMLEPLQVPHFVLHRPNGSLGKYNIASLVDYLLSSRNFTCPQTRQPFSDDDLKRLDALAKQQGISRSLTVAAAKRESVAADSMEESLEAFQASAMNNLEQLAGEAVSRMVTMIETKTHSPQQRYCESLSTALLVDVFPQFSHHLDQIAEISATEGLRCLAHYTRRVQGPPNRPIKDNSGLMRVVTDFLMDKQKLLAKRNAQQSISLDTVPAVPAVDAEAAVNGPFSHVMTSRPLRPRQLHMIEREFTV